MNSYVGPLSVGSAATSQSTNTQSQGQLLPDHRWEVPATIFTVSSRLTAAG